MRYRPFWNQFWLLIRRQFLLLLRSRRSRRCWSRRRFHHGGTGWNRSSPSRSSAESHRLRSWVVACIPSRSRLTLRSSSPSSWLRHSVATTIDHRPTWIRHAHSATIHHLLLPHYSNDPVDEVISDELLHVSFSINGRQLSYQVPYELRELRAILFLEKYVGFVLIDLPALQILVNQPRIHVASQRCIRMTLIDHCCCDPF